MARTPFRSIPLPWRDAILPAVLAVLAIAEMVALQVRGWGYGAALEVLACLLLVWRRRNPLLLPTLAGLTLALVAWSGPALEDASLPIPIWLLCVFALARYNADLRGLIGVSLIAAAVVADILLVASGDQGWPDLIFAAALIAPPFVLGRITRQLTDQKALLEQNQGLVRQQAARDERDRIARELHDVIAHSVSAMVVQTAAAQDLVRTDPTRADEVLGEVAATGRRALAETGRLLHVLRDDADELGLGPAPGVKDLPTLVESFRAGGLAVEFRTDGPLPTLPTGVDISAYRIVQEALTNASRYGAGRTVTVRLSSTRTTLSIQASNPSNGTGGQGGGLGLLGMAERVSLLGGTLSSGVSPGGRFELVATLPLPTAGGRE